MAEPADATATRARSATAPAPEPAAKEKKFEGPITIEQSFKVDGRKLTVLVTFPGAIAQEVGMERLLVAANRAIVTLETKNHKVEKAR